jgi:LysR family glycine cleavage system transcriptional activator
VECLLADKRCIFDSAISSANTQVGEKHMSLAAIPPLNWLRAYEVAARHLSCTAAASELHLTQSAVSQHIRSLENFLGKPLVDRRPCALCLTKDATNYLPAVREAFRVLKVRTSAFPGTRSSSSVTLQCSMGFTTFRLLPRRGALLEAHPWIRLNLVTLI